jgi:adenosylhomocysteine nucleosidase
MVERLGFIRAGAPRLEDNQANSMTNRGYRRLFTTVVIVSADAEWQAVRVLFPTAAELSTPLGDYFTVRLPESSEVGPVLFFHGGWGKIAAAASTQYVIGRWQPDLLINIGTCGGFSGLIEPGEVVLADRTVVYDISEQMGDPDQAVDHYATALDLDWLGDEHPHLVRRTVLISADRDLVPEEVPELAARFAAVAGDWESGAIAWVAARHGTRCLVLRGVTDLVSDVTGNAYKGNLHVWIDATALVMSSLVKQLPAWIQRAAQHAQEREAVP